VHIDKLHVQSKAYQAPALACDNTDKIHPDRLLQIGKESSDIEDYPGRIFSTSEAEESGKSEDKLHNQVLKNCEKFLQVSAFERKKIAKRNLKASKKLLKTKPKKNYKTQTKGIKIFESR